MRIFPDLRFVLTPWQYDKYVALNHFYRPVAWKAGGHNMGNHTAHKAPNREVAQNTRSNHGGSGHFGGHR